MQQESNTEDKQEHETGKHVFKNSRRSDMIYTGEKLLVN